MRNEKVSIYRDPRKKHPWVVRWYGDYDPSSGKARRYSKSFRLKGKADEFQAAKRKELDDGGRRDEPEQVTLHRYLPDWLSSRKPELSDASVDLYEGTIQRLKSYFHADKLVQSVTPRQSAQFIAEQLSFKKGREGQPLSDWKREQIKRHCKTIFACKLTSRGY